MKLTLSLAAAISGLTLCGPSALAQSAYNYPWCGVYQDKSGATSCYFSTYEQCMMTMGHQGFCRQNVAYVGPAGPPMRAAPRRYRRVHSRR